MPRPAMCSTLASLVVLAVSCETISSSRSDRPLLVDENAPRYGRVIVHNDQRTLPIKRGDGIAELFVAVQTGTTRGWWQIDTGAPFCAVTPQVARHEGFTPLVEGDIVTAAGTVEAELGTLPSVRLGGIEIREATVLSLDDNYAGGFTVDGRRGRVIGILGADLLDFLQASIDLRANTLRLRTPSATSR